MFRDPPILISSNYVNILAGQFMKTVGALFLLVSIAVNLSAQTYEKKWIPIKPINENEVSRLDSNKSNLQPGVRMIQNLTMIKNLLDHVSKDGSNSEEKKSWYSFEPADNE